MKTGMLPGQELVEEEEEKRSIEFSLISSLPHTTILS
jgi:hypothetical protein